MRSAHFIFLLTLQMKAFGIFFQSRLAKEFVPRTSASRETSLADPKGGGRIEHLRRVVMLGNATQENSNQPLGVSLQGSSKISNPAVNLAHSRSSSTNAKGFWNQFMFRGRSDFRYVLPIKNIEVRQEKCRALSFSQRIFNENCETLELQNNVCFGKCDTSPSSGEDGGSYHCAVCSPVTVAHKTVKLQCIGNTEITRVIKIIADCQCETKQGQHSHHNAGPVLVDPSVHQ